jgi:predicted DCC family thiol-disulfide oxidoreductase YuxK
MVESEAQPPYPSVGTHVVLYDGVCGLCSRLVQFLLRHDRHRVFSFASLQSGVGKFLVERSGGNPCELASFYVVANYQTAASRAFTRGDAALFVADALGWPWRAAQIVRLVPRAIRDRAYNVVARSRYRVFGRYERCLVQRPEFRNRFIDGQDGEL